MSLEKSMLEKIQALPPEKQQEVLDFVEFLYQRSVGESQLGWDICEWVRSTSCFETYVQRI